jgi:hypothetical protein
MILFFFLNEHNAGTVKALLSSRPLQISEQDGQAVLLQADVSVSIQPGHTNMN